MPNVFAFNNQELNALALRPFMFNREGILIVTSKLKQDGFFRRPEVTQESWCRLLDNLLFYSKTAEQWSEIKGVIVLEKCFVRIAPQDDQGHWPFHLVWNDEVRPTHWLQLATLTECDRVGWLEAIQLAPHEHIKSNALTLQRQLEHITKVNSDMDILCWRHQKAITIDIKEIPLCELSLFCDNLICDYYNDELPSSFLEVHVKVTGGSWIKYGSTEIIENNRNPKFARTVLFRKNDGLDGETVVRITAKHMREKMSNTSVTLGFSTVLLSTIQITQRFRVALKNNDRRTIGFVTLNSWSFQTTNKEEGFPTENDVTPWKMYCHRRSQSLPITLNIKIKLPSHGDIADYLFNNISHSTYRFHTDLGCEIAVHELMAESKLCFALPQELLGIWIQHEKEMLQEVVCIGEMELPWKTNQIELLNKHYSLYKYYNTALENIMSIRKSNKFTFKQSCRKDDPNLEFIPVNLHIQRMWAHDYNLNKSGFYDTVTVGAFTAICQKSGVEGGLFQMVQSKNSNSVANPVQMANEAVQAIKQLRGEVVDTMSKLLTLAKAHKSEGMMPLTEKMVTKTRALLSLWDSGLVEDALRFIDAHKVSSVFTENDDTPENSKMFSMLKRLNLNLNLAEALTPDIEDFATPSTPQEDHLQFLDTEAMCSSPSANYYQPHDEPEPWDLTQLNVEASVMCLVSKIKFLCGHRGSPAVRLRGQKPTSANNRLFASTNGNNQSADESLTKSERSSLDSERNSLENKSSCVDNVVKNNESNLISGIQTIPIAKKCNRFTDGLNLADVLDWASELRPSMRKLRQAMDGLLKGGRLAHAILRIQQDQSVLQKAISLQVRRDVCFSQALTSLVTGLLCWLWSNDIDTVTTILKSGLGPLCYFEGLLTLYESEYAMWGDMVIAIEDLQTVAFQLVRWNHRETPLPQIKGSRTSLTVTLPVQPELLAKFSDKENMKFTITPIYFNIGINEMATVAESLGTTTPQYKSNIDNFDRLYEYHLRYQKLNLPKPDSASKGAQKSKSFEDIILKTKKLVQKKGKNVELLMEAAYITRKLGGIRFTSCKSGKDRTSMSCTLEQCNILTEEYNLACQEFKKTLDCTRSEGCRRENTMKNIGVRKYAFNKAEVMELPCDYRPPLGTYGSTQT